MRACSVPGCTKAAAKSGMCGAHYQKWWKRGDALYVHHKPNDGRCSIAGCAKPPRSRTSHWCEMHYARWRRNGDPIVHRQATGRAISEAGYLLVRQPAHVLARADGWVYEHRLVLYVAIGPGAHECHWCGTRVTWDLSYPQHQDALVVDHLDDDKANNEPSNLVPSCARCNLARAQRSAS